LSTTRDPHEDAPGSGGNMKGIILAGGAGVAHVEMYAGGDLTWGHGGGLHGEVPGPHKNSLSKFIRDTRGIGWCVKRYIND